MSDKTYQFNIDSFYYNSPQQTGLQVTAMTPTIPPTLRVPLENFMCTIACGGDSKDERMVYCAPLGSFCKVFISRDVQYARDYFYHAVTVGEKSFLKEFGNDEDAFVNRIRGILLEKSTASSLSQQKELPRVPRVCPTISTDSVGSTFINNRDMRNRLVFLAFMPILSLGSFTATLRFPASAEQEAMSREVTDAALFMLSVLPEELHKDVRMRFTADNETLTAKYDCNYLFMCGDAQASFDSAKCAPLRAEEDPFGIFAALGDYIGTYGLAAYRRNILPALNNWTIASRRCGHISFDFLYLVLSGIRDLKMPARNADLSVLLRVFGKMDASWFELSASYLLSSLRNLPQAKQLCKEMESNPLFTRDASTLPEDGMDPFFLLYATLYSGAPYADKEATLQGLYDRFAGNKHGLALLQKVKSVMAVTLQLPADPTPENIFAGLRSLERNNPDYAKYVADAAADGYAQTLNEEWLNCLNTIYSDPATAQAVGEVLDIRCEDLLQAAQDRKFIGWICTLCKERVAKDPVCKQSCIRILLNKMISYEELLLCLRAMEVSESELPARPEPKILADSVNSLQALASVTVPKKADDAAAVQAGMLERLCRLLEGDCTWADFRKYIPAILEKADFKPTMRLQPKIENLLLRQLAVLAPDILTVQGGQTAYAELLVQLRKDFCLCLYPVSGAAAGKFDEKKRKSSAFGKALLRVLPFVCLAATIMVSVLVLFVLLPAVPVPSPLHIIVPAAFCAAGLLFILLQTLIIRRHAAAEYFLPCAAAMLAAGLLQLLL